ncbi:MAG TPA: glycoside hydrolase family protein [Lacunisphaera sp.]
MITRRQFLHLSAAATALSLAPALRPQAASAKEVLRSGARKRGLGQAVKIPDWAARLAALRCQWFYSWNHRLPEGVPPGIEFVPMVFRYGGKPEVVAAAADSARKSGCGTLLGFNEPDGKEQGNMTVEQALEAWPLLMETGLRLGSPGCIHPDKEWMTAFMEGVKQRQLRVDFVCVHSYGGPNAEALVQRLEKVHQTFGCPVWITEFAVGDWTAKSVDQNRHKSEDVLRFMEKVLPMLDRLDFVERYAWFPAKPDNRALGTSALFDENGALTRLGECYRDA